MKAPCPAKSVGAFPTASVFRLAAVYHGTFFAITGFVTLPLIFMSNAFVPVDAMPGWMAVVARVNPLTYAIEAMRILVPGTQDGPLAGGLGAEDPPRVKALQTDGENFVMVYNEI